MADLSKFQWGRLLGRHRGPNCGHGTCSQNYIDTGDRSCIEVPRRDRTFAVLCLLVVAGILALMLCKGGGK